MEKLLQKIARQLDALDEASLMSLWSKYATITSRFEPTKRWEEACLIFSLIQAKRWKNQLFNYSWSRQRTLPEKDEADSVNPFPQPDFTLEAPPDDESSKSAPAQCVVMAFQPKSD